MHCAYCALRARIGNNATQAIHAVKHFNLIVNAVVFSTSKSSQIVGNILHSYAYNVNRFLLLFALAPISPRQLRDLPVEPRKVTFPNRVVRREGCHTRHDGPPSSQRI
jgi:hypothetical protein